MQKRIAAAVAILNLLDGLPSQPCSNLLLVVPMTNRDCPTRFNEWGLAAWSLQKDALLPSGRGSHRFDIHFLSFVPSEDDGEFSGKLPNQVSALMMAETRLFFL